MRRPLFVPSRPRLVPARPDPDTSRARPPHRDGSLATPPLPSTIMPRRHDIDALRVIAFGLLIVYHVGMGYVADWGFHVKSAYKAEWLHWTRSEERLVGKECVSTCSSSWSR